MEKGINFDQSVSFTEKYNVELEVIQRTKLITQLVKLREGAGLTQKELGKEVGMTQEKLTNIEKGVQSPRVDELLKLANYFNQELTLESN